jgi:GntR family transcriptional regulator, transcriptional repressor for pyruvate dehydrogenase complex
MLEQKTLASQATDYLERLIVEGKLEEGSPLPSQAELAAQLGVSRLVIREATKTLEARGLIRAQQGKRLVVAGVSVAPLQHFFELALRRDADAAVELVEARKAIEVHNARLAAQHATDEDVAELADRLEQLARAEKLEEFVEADIAFHAALARMSRNSILAELVTALEEPLRASRVKSVEGAYKRGASLEPSVAEHRAIYEAVAAQDPSGAAGAMEQHLDKALVDLLASTAQRRNKRRGRR